MSRRSRRRDTLFQPDAKALLAAFGKVRTAMAQAQAKLRYGSPLYVAISAVGNATDAVAELITGDRHFLAADASTGPTHEDRWEKRLAEAGEAPPSGAEPPARDPERHRA